MKKKYLLPALLMVMTVCFSACGKQEVGPATLPTEEAVVPVETPAETPAAILNGAQDWGNGLWYIPNEAVEATTWPILEEFQGNLLLSQAENSDGYNADMHTTLIDSCTGKTLAETTRKMLDYQMPKALRDTVAYLEGNDEMTITFLNEKLERVSSVTVDGLSPNCFLSPDGNTLYSLAYDSGITALDLSTKERKEILTNVTNLDSYTVCGPYVPIAYDDCSTDMRVYGSLNLETGELELAPCQEACTRLMRCGDVWQAAEYNEASSFRIGTDEHPNYLYVEESELQLLDNRKILRSTYTTGDMAIYEMDGTCLASAVLPEDLHIKTNVPPIWSEALGGYFLLASSDESRYSRLVFWDLSENNGTKTDLNLTSWEEKHQTVGGQSADPKLYAWAETLFQRYGVTVSIGDQCTHEFSDFTYEQCNDDDALLKGLAYVEKALGYYPDGFFSQLAYGPVRDLHIYLAKGLEGGEYFGNDRSYSGFGAEDGAANYIVLNAECMHEENVFHEISHIIDRKLSYHASLHDNVHDFESGWMELQPEGFGFCYDYSDIPALTQEYLGWFIDDYSQSYPTEDRARIMEYAMRGDADQTFGEAPHLAAKLQYYSDCIRECFDTAGWPEVTRWEKALHTAD